MTQLRIGEALGSGAFGPGVALVRGDAREN